MTQLLELDARVTSVFEAAWIEARRHQWIESQKAGFDRGDAAFRDWYGTYWWSFLRYRHTEHLLGEREWEDFESKSFSVLAPYVEREDWLAREIIEQYRIGAENLEILNRAMSRGWPINEVHNCLLLINMNDARLNPRFQ